MIFKGVGLAWVALLVGVSGPSLSCADLSRGEPAANAAAGDAGPADGGTTDGNAASGDAALSFASPIHGLLTDACQSCHVVGQEAGDTALLFTNDQTADYAGVSGFVNVAAPASSPLLTKMAGRGHGGGTLYASDAPEYQTVLRWIQEGARP